MIPAATKIRQGQQAAGEVVGERRETQKTCLRGGRAIQHETAHWRSEGAQTGDKSHGELRQRRGASSVVVDRPIKETAQGDERVCDRWHAQPIGSCVKIASSSSIWRDDPRGMDGLRDTEPRGAVSGHKLYGSSEAKFDKDILSKWTERLGSLLEMEVQDGITFKEEVGFRSPLHSGLWERVKSRDPDQCIDQI